MRRRNWGESITTFRIEEVPVGELTFDSKNARKHSKTNLLAIAESLRQFGQRKPIVVTADNVIVAGNGTVEAALSLGWLELAVVRVPTDWTADQVKAFALADNRTAELAEWNHELLVQQIIELQEVNFDVQALGFDVLETPNDSEWGNAFDATAAEQKDVQQITFTLHKDQVESVKQALIISKELGDFIDTKNLNANGNALARICELWAGQTRGR